MSYVDREKHMKIIISKPDCFNKCDPNDFQEDLEKVLGEYKKIVSENTMLYASTWLLEKDLWLRSEKKECQFESDTLSRGRVVLVNPGVSKMGREQRYVHPYIVLAEYKETFIGVPITNKAFNKSKKQHYLRNFFEVDLRDPEYKKPFEEYRCSKPSVADIRNISGLDKRRIIKNELYGDKKFVPKTYLNAISKKIIESIAIIHPEENE